MFYAQIKTVAAVVGAIAIVGGTGGTLAHQAWSAEKPAAPVVAVVAAAGEKAAPPEATQEREAILRREKEKEAQKQEVAKATVDGLYLRLDAEKSVLARRPRPGRVEGGEVQRAVENPGTHTLTFFNLGKKPIKLNAYLIADSLTYEVIEPAGNIVKRRCGPLFRTATPAPQERDFPLIEPGQSWSTKVQLFAPGLPQDFYWGGPELKGYGPYYFLQAGSYRVSVSYSSGPSSHARDDLSAGAWSGTVRSDTNVEVLDTGEPVNDLAVALQVSPSTWKPGNPIRLTCTVFNSQVASRLGEAT